MKKEIEKSKIKRAKNKKEEKITRKETKNKRRKKFFP